MHVQVKFSINGKRCIKKLKIEVKKTYRLVSGRKVEIKNSERVVSEVVDKRRSPIRVMRDFFVGDIPELYVSGSCFDFFGGIVG